MNAFAHAVQYVDNDALCAESLDLLSVNIGLKCNMACSHCHQDSSPRRTEMMSRADMRCVADIVESVRPRLVDITGGAPELHPELPYLLALLAPLGVPMQLRSNLTALLEPAAAGVLDLLVRHRVHVLASLPGTSADEVCGPRGDAFGPSVQALRMLSSAGYGCGPELSLDIAVNPDWADRIPPRDPGHEFRIAIEDGLGVCFRKLVVITTMPIGRFRGQLQRDGSFDAYRSELREAFNPGTVGQLACRTSLSIGWDGTLSDCDFNLGAGMRVADGVPSHISDFDAHALATRPIRFAEHCFGCTALQGSG